MPRVSHKLRVNRVLIHLWHNFQPSQLRSETLAPDVANNQLRQIQPSSRKRSISVNELGAYSVSGEQIAVPNPQHQTSIVCGGQSMDSNLRGARVHKFRVVMHQSQQNTILPGRKTMYTNIIMQQSNHSFYFLSVPITDSGAYLGMTLGSWSMLNSSVASRPAYNKMAFSPPGWSARNFNYYQYCNSSRKYRKRTLVTSSTWPSIITQQSSFLLCFATSSAV